MSENEGAEGGTADGADPEGDPATDAADPETEDETTREPDGTETADPGAGEGTGGADEAIGTDEQLRERVADAEPGALAREIAALRERARDAEERAAEAEERVDELESKLKRKQADFRNFKKRQQRKLEDRQRRATEDLVERLLDVRDNLVRALDQDADADIRPGVEKTLDQFDRVLDAEDVRTIDPEPGEEVDPERHEVLMRVDSEHPAGTVEGVHRPGYEMADRVLRPAQVTVAEEGEG
jgi:molecular chaperone GrpE